MTNELLCDLEKNESVFVRLCVFKFKEIYSASPEYTDAEQELFELVCWNAAIQYVIEKKTGKSIEEVVPINILGLLYSIGVFETLNNIEFNLFIKGIRFESLE